MATVEEQRALAAEFAVPILTVKKVLEENGDDVEKARKRLTVLTTPIDTRIAKLEAENERLLAANVTLNQRIQALEDMHNQTDVV